MNRICGLVSSDLQASQMHALLGEMLRSLPLHPGSGTSLEVQRAEAALGAHQQFEAGATPPAAGSCLLDREGLTIVCSAEIYSINGTRYQEQRPEAEVLAELYRRHRKDCVRRLRGVFAIAIWDWDKKVLLLATDPFAVRTLHYYADREILVFGSRINAILKAPIVPRDIHPDAIYQYIYHSCIPTPNTVYRDIKKLPPGHLLLFSREGSYLERYWRMSYEEERGRDLEYYASGVRDHVLRAVRSQAKYGNNTTGVGSFLSGGTDSSTVSGMLGQVLQKPAPTFSIGFKEHGFNEIEYARIAARHFGTDYHDYFVSPEDTAKIIPELVSAYDEPFGNASAVPAYYCAKLAHDAGIETLLAGDGGDELFGGNTRYATDKVFEVYQTLPHWLRTRCLEPIVLGIPVPERGVLGKARKYMRRSNLPQPMRFFSYNLLYTVDPHEIFADDFLSTLTGDPGLEVAARHYKDVPATSMLNRLLHVDLKITITDNDLRKVTRMCELANVKVRFPMLDLELVEFSGRIPADLKVRGFEKRFIFKEAFKNFLPQEILRKKKHGFGLPVSAWLREDPHLNQLSQDTLLSKSSLQRGYFRPAFLRKLFALHGTDHTNFFGDNIWVFLMLELWHQAQHPD